MTISTNIKSVVFKKAWSIVKSTKKTLSQALKMAWSILKRHASKSAFIAECHFEESVLPFKKECGADYVGVIYQNRYKNGIEGWESEIGGAVDSLSGFNGYVISVTSKWFELFNAEQFKKDIDSLCLRIAGKKVTCKHESDSQYIDGSFYKWAINPASLDQILAIATKYKLKISLS